MGRIAHEVCLIGNPLCAERSAVIPTWPTRFPLPPHGFRRLPHDCAQGRELAVFEPAALANHELAVSPDGRFIAAATFSTDVKIWEMKYSREGEFRGGWWLE